MVAVLARSMVMAIGASRGTVAGAIAIVVTIVIMADILHGGAQGSPVKVYLGSSFGSLCSSCCSCCSSGRGVIIYICN